MYSPAGRYDIALSHASSPEHRMTILRAQADHYYSLKNLSLLPACERPVLLFALFHWRRRVLILVCVPRRNQGALQVR